MKVFLGTVSGLALSASVALAEPTGVFRQAHEVGSGATSNLDPMSNGRVFQITEKIMSRLVRSDMDGRPSPDLAVGWSANEDATEWMLELRSGVTFHDGSSFGPEDVVYSLERILDPEMDSPVRSAISMINNVEAVGEDTVKLTLDNSFADLPLVLMDYRLRIIPEGSGGTIATTGIGTGPFRLVSFNADGVTKLEANMDYFGGAPGVAEMEIIGIPDAQARLQALLGGQIDMERGITAQQSVMLSGSDRFEIQTIPTGNWRGLVFRADVAPFDDVRVRQALRLAADRQAMVDLVVAEGFKPAHVEPVERYAFYEKIKGASLIVQSNKNTAYGNALFCKGVILV
jgi:peptide/nickel transport system substrate-binding protein